MALNPIQNKVIEALRKRYSLAAAAQEHDVSFAKAYSWLKDEEFLNAFNMARKEAASWAEDALFKAAIEHGDNSRCKTIMEANGLLEPIRPKKVGLGVEFGVNEIVPAAETDGISQRQ